MLGNEHPLVHVRVAVNVGSMRRGQELQLPLTEQVEGLSLAGYIQILGHVHLSAVAAPVAATPLPLGEGLSPAGKVLLPERMEFEQAGPELPATAPRIKKSRRKVAEVDDGGSESPA